jgi:hypothetical protein
MDIKRSGVVRILCTTVTVFGLLGCGLLPAINISVGATQTPVPPTAPALPTNSPPPFWTATSAFTPTPRPGPLTWTKLLYISRDTILSDTPLTTAYIQALCQNDCTVPFTFILGGDLKGNVYKFEIPENPGRLSLRLYHNPYGTKDMNLLAEWKDTGATQGQKVGQAFDGHFGDKIILQVDLPAGVKVLFGRVYYGKTDPSDNPQISTISIGTQENAPANP